MISSLARPLATTVCLALLSAWPVAGADHRVIRLGVPPWQGAQVKSAVVTQLLERLGWTVEWTEATAPQGLDSLAELPDWAGALERRVHCIEPGSGANTVTQAAIEQDLYGLGDWSIIASSIQAMLAQVGRALRRGEPIVFCAWRPHWMNVGYELRYLDDPEGHRGGAPGSTQVLTLARADLAADCPNVAALLSRFRVDAAVQSRWIHEYARLDRDRDRVARDWIAGRSELVASWLRGLKAADGTPATERFEAGGVEPARRGRD